MSESTLEAIAKALESKDPANSDAPKLPVGATTLLQQLSWYDNVNDATLWAAALLLVVMNRGGACIKLSELTSLPGLSAVLPAPFNAYGEDEWRAALVGDVFGDGKDQVRPLVISDDRLYVDRVVRMEREIARHLVMPLGPAALPEPDDWASTVSSLFTTEGSDLQRELASSLFSQRVTVLSGGPGTGKTFTVATIILAIYRATGGNAAVKICAPTGKAAQRINESLAVTLAKAGSEDEERADILGQTKATTIHKLLGITPLAPRRRRSDPLHVDFVICDETSMVDLAVLSELLRATSEDTRILLVGDRNQLPSIDVGSVMDDLFDAKDHLRAVELDKLFRLDEGIAADDRELLINFFAAIRDRNTSEALALLDSGSSVLSHIDVTDDGELGEGGEAVVAKVIERAELLVSLATLDADPMAIKEALEGVMVLAAQHRNPLSRYWWVNKIAPTVYMSPLPQLPVRKGLPVLVTKTDAANGVTNGDTGLIREGANGRLIFSPTMVAASDVSDEVEVRALPATAIHDWQPWWAMTIHKSQGSEFGHVIVSITPDTRLLSRELLYTAVTRAKSKVTIIGRRSDIEKAITTETPRYSGLVDKIIEAARAQGED
jgi:exodeoxyribonuclease V alpha subunit